MSFQDGGCWSGFSFFLPLFRDFLLFAFCLSGSCTGVRKDTKTIFSLGSIYNYSLNGLYLSNKRRFRQVPKNGNWYFEWDLEPTYDERCSTLMCSGITIIDTVAPWSMINFVIRGTSWGKWPTIVHLWSQVFMASMS